MKIGGCPLFCNSGKAGMYQHSQSEGAAWHRRWHSKGIGDVPPNKQNALTYVREHCLLTCEPVVFEKSAYDWFNRVKFN
ncbi:hypothetical protein DWV78_09970 [Agathobacter rectalis]|uniref:Uncharacterized protein n=1 Tax=Agathobacter rectalis TaxID=39491 RepID=A0A413BF17_9FIRM|nr:hypothetical protein DWV78_09970 [Agathobacter rectalis]